MKLIKNILTAAILLLSIFVYAQEELIFAATLIRHGDRSPYAKMESTKIKYNWPQGIGELTSEGMRQEYNLGQQLRNRYIETFRLLPENYQNGIMYVLSTDYNRTLMSVESLLLGLYTLRAQALI